MSVVNRKHGNNTTQKSLWYYLRYGLNEDCLVELLNYLHLHDLMQICDLDTENDQYFTCLIRGRVIGKKLIDLEPRYKRQKVWSFTKTFETFGPFIKRLKIPLRSNHFDYILRKIIAHIAPGTLTEVQFLSLQSDDDTELPMNDDLLQQTIPYFSNVKKVEIEDEVGILLEMYKVLLNLSNLRSLKMCKANGGSKMWTELITNDSLNVTELKVIKGNVCGDDLAKLMQKLPHLEVFEWHGQKSCSALCEALVKHCPKLRIYGDYCKKRSNDPRYYDFLGHFKHLIEVTLTTKSTDAHDLKSTLQILAHHNQLHQLTVYQSDVEKVEPIIGIDEPFFMYSNGFSNLKKIIFYFHYYSAIINFEQSESFFRNLLTSMHGLQKITLMSQSFVFNIPKILQFIPQIQEIGINQNPLHQMPAEVRRIRKFIQQISDQRQNNSKIHIYMNAEQAREFSVFKNFDQIAKIVIKNQFVP